MTLNEVIKHIEGVAERNEKNASWFWEKEGNPNYENCVECAKEHRQLAGWLKELKDYREHIPSYEAGYNDAKREIALSGEYERAYERGKADAQPKTGRWIHRGDMDYLDKNKVVHNHFMCQDCGFIYDFIDGHTAQYNYCPNCGVKMIEWQESEDK